MADMVLEIPHALEAWAKSRVAEGRFEDVGDYVRDLIRRDEARAAQVSQIVTVEASPSFRAGM
jgi:antitoxin ParD1/3/4